MAVRYKIRAVLTDNGIQFTFPPRYADGPAARYVTHMFDMRCRKNGIEHRLIKVRHPWTNGQVDWMNRTIKDDSAKRYHYEDHAQPSRRPPGASSRSAGALLIAAFLPIATALPSRVHPHALPDEEGK